MSGIVGIINFDGAPIDQSLLRRMNNFMIYRGPDAQEILIDNNVGFGHTMLRTTWEAESEKQPLTLDGTVWLVADARIDGRSDLIPELEAKLGGRLAVAINRKDQSVATSNGSILNNRNENQRTPNDAELILLSYQAWGTECVTHLIGDFAFAIWDAQNQRLFCARDRFGFKPFYYVRVGSSFIFSNTLNCLRLHPEVSSQLDDLAIADFLLFGFNRSLTTTSFADIQRLPPANSAILSRGNLVCTTYWKASCDDNIRYQKASDYTEHFKSLLQSAVSDRLRSDRVGLKMSGGVDSTTVAAIARQIEKRNHRRVDLRAYTVVYDKLMQDSERHFSELAAKALQIPIQHFPADDYKPFDRWDQPALQAPEPVESFLGAVAYDVDSALARDTRVLLGGLGGDGCGLSLRTYIVSKLRSGEFGELFKDYGTYVLAFWNRPPARLLNSLKLRLGLIKYAEPEPFPQWLNETLVQDYELRSRWREVNSNGNSSPDTLRAGTLAAFTSPGWVAEFEACDPGITHVPVEYRQPLFDVRLVSFILSVPPVPHWLNKRLLRSASRGLLPRSVRLRPKRTPLKDPVRQYLNQAEAGWIDRFQPLPQLNRYIDREKVPKLTHSAGISVDESLAPSYYLHLRPIALNTWMSWSNTQIKTT